MVDLFMPEVVPHVTRTVAKHAHIVKPVITHAAQGASMLTLIISNLVTAGLAGGMAWYVKGRGMTGVKMDINNMKMEIEKLNAQITSKSV